jgi:hypothetical protein
MKSICPPNKFGFGDRCVTWLYILCIFALFAALVICLCIYFDKVNIKNLNTEIDMINLDIDNDFNSNNILNTNLLNPLNSFNLNSNYDDKSTSKYKRFIRVQNENSRNTLDLNQDRDINININVPSTEHKVPNVNQISYPNYIHQKNHERVINPLLPPERSYENTYGVPINIPTRGSSGGFQQVGMLYKQDISNSSATIGNNSETAVFPLYGRPIYPGSNKWSYYTASDKFNSVKMPISHNGRRCDADYGCQELYTGDMIQIPAYNGNFKVEIYDYDKPRYIPYVH